MKHFTQLEDSFPNHSQCFTKWRFYKLDVGYMFGLN
ncbi:MAG: hypothetical protein ACI9M9_000096 [Flavobacteriaceae bacterium]|jgi:hypothetical protein